MSSSQFDDLLGDFGDGSTTTTTTTTTTKTTSNGAMDDFDPFGPSDPGQTSNGGDSGLLLDFSADAEVKNGEPSNGLDFQFDTTTSDSSSANPLYDMSADTQSSNPLHDLSSANPLYDLSEADANQSSNPMYDFSSETTTTTTTTTSSEPTNPLYDFETGGTTNDAPQDTDFFSGTNEAEEEVLQQHQEEEVLEANESASNDADLIGGGDFEVENNNVELEQDFEPQVMNGNARDFVPQMEDIEPEEEVQEEVQEEVEQPSENVEIFEEEEEIIEDGRTVTKTTRTEKRSSGSGFETTQRSSQEISLSQWEAEKNRQNADIGKQQGEQDIVQFTEMSSVKNKFESQPQAPPPRQYDVKQEVQASEGGVYESQPQAFQQWQNEEEEEEGVYESTPIKRDDVAREADRDLSADLPAVGTAKSIKERFMMSSQESTQRSKREITPPAHGAGGEYVSEPRGYVEKYEGKAEAGVFESQPQGHNPEVVTSETNLEDYRPQQGYAKNIMSRYKEMATKGDSFTPSSKREITPDRSGRVEFVSEPRGQVERYEGKADSGVFESEPALNPDVVRSGEEVREELPERGYAKNLVNRFKQIGSDTSPPSASTRKRDITPDRSGKIEYSNEPQRNPDVVTSDPVAEEYVPASGFARNVAAKFREMESSAKSPPLSPGRRKEFTPPREEERAKQSVVLENNPEFRQEVIHSGDQLEEALPERGTAKNIAQRFRQMASENTSSSPRAKKEITPPPNNYSGVFENEPKQFQADYNRPAESGILENQPILRDDVVRGTEPPKYEEELPERGAAKNLVSKWRQMESESAKAKSPTSGRPKEFTPPREEPRIAQARKSPRTPKSPSDQVDNGSVHPSDLPGQYQPLNEPNVFESTPEYRQDAVREADTDWTEGMPKKDSAKKMLAKFQNIQAEAKKQQPPPGSRKETEPKRKTPRKVGRSKSMRAAIQTEKCGACEKTVYAMERLEMNKRVYHKACFRCTQCKAVLTPKTFAINNDVIFCTSHYKQLFATKGNYDEGFGRMQHKKRWSSNPNLADREMKDADAGAENENS